MSSASIPAPTRTGSSPGSRNNFFWPIFIYLCGATLLAFYQLESLNSQLAEITSAADRLDPQVKLAEYEKAKFFAMARDLLRMAPTHPAAEELVTELNIRKLAIAQPVLMSLTLPSGFTNTAPMLPKPPAPEQAKTNMAPAAFQ